MDLDLYIVRPEEVGHASRALQYPRLTAKNNYLGIMCMKSADFQGAKTPMVIFSKI